MTIHFEEVARPPLITDMAYVRHSGSYPNTCIRSILQLVVASVPGIILLLLILLHSPASAQEEPQWTTPDLGAYSDLPIEVRVGVKIDQITSVDQKAENFGAVVHLKMEWYDPNLAFDPSQDQIPVRRYSTGVFRLKANEENIFFPTFSVYNQQGRRFSNASGVVIFPDGKVVHAERLSVTLQAPDFDFKSYPFDTQHFFISIDTQWPSHIMTFVADQDFSGFGDQLGEEEWAFHNLKTEVRTKKSIFGLPSSRFTFMFDGLRHIQYYVLRIIIPLFVIVMVSWATFFLRDFSKRVDISASNLLVYVAFNFTISNDLPRLGYITFMDSILAAAFVITSLTVMWNVLLRRLEQNGKEGTARIMDTYTLWIYPGAYLLVIIFAWRHFLPGGMIEQLLSGDL